MPGYKNLNSAELDFENIVEKIYDCAANPEHWTTTLSLIRDRFGGAYTMVGLSDISELATGGAPIIARQHSPWNPAMLDDLQKVATEIPNLQEFMMLEPDQAWSQLNSMAETLFQETSFYKKWVAPNGLRDVVNVPFIKRESMMGMLSIASDFKREPFSSEDRLLAEKFSPHIRRAMMINDLTDKGRMALQLYRQVIDQLASAVLVIGPGRKIVIANEAAEQILRDGEFLKKQSGSLCAARVVGQVSALEDAIDRALQGDTAIGISGIGVPLIGEDGSRAAAYVLPVAGKDIRGSFGSGHCIVFMARRQEQQPIVIEILRTLYDLTAMEARVASLLSSGVGPAAIADSLTISVNTVRTHLKHAFAKTETSDQVSLVGLVNSLVPPMMVK